jgi:membrane-associated phospholipid phosphatase
VGDPARDYVSRRGGLGKVFLIRSWSERRFLLASLAASLFVVLAVLVGADVLTRLDQWSVDHLMPGLTSIAGTVHLLDSAFPIFDPSKHHGHEAISAVTYGVVWLASAVPSLVLVAAAMSRLRSRGQGHLALRLGLAFVAVNAVELTGKTMIARHALFATAGGKSIHVRAFDSSFPSGHMSRAIVLAACLIVCFPRARLAAFLWAAVVAMLLVAGGWHTPSDVAGGLALGVTASLVATRRIPPSHSAS